MSRGLHSGDKENCIFFEKKYSDITPFWDRSLIALKWTRLGQVCAEGPKEQLPFSLHSTIYWQRPRRIHNYCAEGVSCSATRVFYRLVFVCLSVNRFMWFLRGATDAASLLWVRHYFQLWFLGIPEKHDKTEKTHLQEWSHRTPFWDPFLAFFLKKFRFSLEGLVKVRHLVLVRTTGDFAQVGATLPGGSI